MKDKRNPRAGSALVMALMIVSLVAMLGLSMLSSGISGSKVTNGQSDEYRLTSAVESVGALAVENLWSGYLLTQGGAAGDALTFREYLNDIGIPNSGPGGPPPAQSGVSLLVAAGVPGAPAGNPQFDDVDVDALNVVRRDEDIDTTQLYITVSATTTRGAGHANPTLNRAIQAVYTIEPAPFEGFDYGILTNNVNCVFCHTVVDSAERVYNTDPDLCGTFDKVKVGTLESLMLRSNNRPTIGDFDADSVIAGTLYVRGSATNQNGTPISNWGGLEMHSCLFDEDGNLIQDEDCGLQTSIFSPAGTPPEAGENLYLNYPTVYSEMPDGKLPTTFPPPFPDNGGIDPETGLPTDEGADNHTVDPNEFYAVAQQAQGTISGGAIHVTEPGEVIDQSSEYLSALTVGNQSSIQYSTVGNVVLHGTQADPIVLAGPGAGENGSHIAIDGDLVITGWIKGKGSIYVSGNVYIPGSLQYLDGENFGVGPTGGENVLALAAGGNILIGDYLAPGMDVDSETGIVSGSPPPDPPTAVDNGLWNFALAEISLFNRTQWSHTQPVLPGPGEDHNDPSSWTAVNPGYEPDYMPYYYQFGPGDEIPIYNLHDLYFDSNTETWLGTEHPTAWDPSYVTILDPDDHSNPLLYNQQTGLPVASILQVTPHDGWLSDEMQKFGLDYFAAQHQQGTPIQIDGLLYTNHAIFGIVDREGVAEGQIEVNGSIVCADLGLLSPGIRAGVGQPGTVPGSPYKAGLRLNYDVRTRPMLNVTNPNAVTIKRTLWSPTANVL